MARLLTLILDDPVAGTAAALLDAPLGGGETFQGSRKPDFSPGPGLGVGPVAIPSTGPTLPVGGGYAYTLTLPSPIYNQSNGGLWYVRTVAAGAAVSGTLPVWMDPSLIGLYCAGGRALRDILLANKPGIDLWLAAVDPALKYQAAVFGADWNTSALTPGTLVKPYSCRATYEEEPRGRLTIMSYAVTSIIRAVDAANEAEGVSQLTEGVERILNQACYETYQFADGTLVNGGSTEDYQFSDDFMENVWASRSSFVWHWECIRYTG